MKATTLVPAAVVALAYSSGVLSSGRTDTVCRLNIVSAPLDDALREVGRQCAVQILYYSDLTAGKTAPPLNGEYAVDDAMRRLLDGAGLTFRQVNAMTLQVVRAALIKTRVARSNDRREPAKESALQEVVINGTAEGLVATRIETPLQQIPQTISLISAEQIRQQNNFALSDALEEAPGITALRKDSFFYLVFSRGFSITSYTLDGGGGLRAAPQIRFGPPLLLTPDLGEFDHVEVLRGANALFGADGTPGGAINLVRKRPLHEATLRSASSAGSWNTYRQEVDITGPLALDGTLRGRLDASDTRRDYFYKYAHDARKSIFGVLDYDLTEKTLLTAGGSYSKSRARPFEVGLPMLSDGTDPHLPRSTSYTFGWSRFDTRLAEGYLRLDQAFSGESRLKVQATFLDNTVSYAFGHIARAINPATGTIGRPQAQYTTEPFRQKQFNVEATLTGTGQWGDRSLEWVLGGDFLRTDAAGVIGQLAFGTPIASASRFDPAEYPYPIKDNSPISYSQDTTTILAGLFSSLRVQLTRPWSLTAGFRVSKEHISDDTVNYLSGREFPMFRDYEYKHELTPYLGTLFALNDIWSVYASYATIFLSNFGTVRSDGSLVPPSNGINMEAGVKGAWYDGMLNGSVALYKIVQRGVALLDPNTAPSGLCCWTSGGRNESIGVDMELAGHLAPRWLIGSGYTFNQSEQVAAGNAATVPLYEMTPRHLIRLWTSYGLPGSWQRLSIGGTLQAQSAAAPPALRTTQKSYAVLSSRAGFQFNPNWQAALSINNVFDRRYYATLSGTSGGNWYGEPRQFLVRLDGRF